MFSLSAELYDLIYGWKDYQREVAMLRSIVREATSDARTWLDVACGTGRHLELLGSEFEVTGVDIQPEMVEIARRRLPDATLVAGDMRTFRLERKFDVVSCLFGSVGYLGSPRELEAAVTNMARHLAAGGVLIVEPFLTPDRFDPDHLSRPMSAQTDTLTVVRMNGHRLLDDGRVMLEMHYLVARPGSVEHFVEEHILSLFTDADFGRAFESAGLVARHDPDGLMGRGLWIANDRPAKS